MYTKIFVNKNTYVRMYIPKAVAGGPSVTRLTHNKCKGVKGSGKPRIVEIRIVNISPKYKYTYE
jgi:hypothetical protein